VNHRPEFNVLLCTDGQKDDIARFCCMGYGVSGIDTTFNLGDYLVTLVTYRNGLLQNITTKESPVLIGPAWIHQKRTFDSYFEFALALRLCGIKDIKVIGTDGDENLGRAFEEAFPNSIHLYCQMHIMDNIKDLRLESSQSIEIENELFGFQIGNVKTKGLVDAESELEFDQKFDKFKTLLENMSDPGKKFLDYFNKYKYKVFKYHMRADLRRQAGLGNPPRPYYNHANESMNAVIKLELDAKLTISEFIKHYENLVERQRVMMEVLLVLVIML
jgi:hypothetical protein